MCSIGPAWRGNGEEVMAKVDESHNVLPVVEIVVLKTSGAEKEKMYSYITHMKQ